MTLMMVAAISSVAEIPICYLFIGSYTDGKTGEGLYVYRFNCETGEVAKLSTVKTVTNPSWVTVAPNGRYLYACTETRMPHKGSLSSYSFDSLSGKLTFINQRHSGGENPVYAVVNRTGKWLVNANYTEAGVFARRINNDGSIGDMGSGRALAGHSFHADRQEAAHAHASVFSPTQDYLYVPDLGGDKIWCYGFDPERKDPILSYAPAPVECETGSGPRHMVFAPEGKFAYCLEELSGTVSVYEYKYDGTLTRVQRLASYHNTEERSISADIHVSPDGRFLYTSNRENENSITIFSINEETGLLTLAGYQSTMGEHPRNFIIDPTGNFLLVANMLTNNIVVFRRDVETGLLQPTGVQIKVNHPSSLQMRQYNVAHLDKVFFE